MSDRTIDLLERFLRAFGIALSAIAGHDVLTGGNAVDLLTDGWQPLATALILSLAIMGKGGIGLGLGDNPDKGDLKGITSNGS